MSLFLIRKLWSQLLYREKQNVIVLVLLVLIVGLSEMVGLGSIFPFLKIISDPEVIYQHKYFHYITSNLVFINADNLVYYSGFFLIVFFSLTQVLSAYLQYFQNKFVNNLGAGFTQRLFNKYLNQNMAFFSQTSSHHISQMVLSEVSQVVIGVIRPGVDLIARSFIALTIIVFLFLFDSLSTLFILIAFTVYFLIVSNFFKKQLKNLGQMRLKLNEQRYKLIGEVFIGIKDIKILNVGNYFSQKLNKISEQYANYSTQSSLIAELPGYLLNIILFVGLMTFTLYQYHNAVKIEQMIPLIGVYAFAGYRLMPSIKLLYSEISKVRYNLASFEKLIERMSEPVKQPIAHKDSLATFEVLDLKHIYFKYPNSSKDVLVDINLRIKKGDLIAFVGKTGEGKSTLLDILAGLLSPTSGDICVDGVKISESQSSILTSLFSYIPQSPFLLDGTIEENVVFGLAETKERSYLINSAKLANLDAVIKDKESSWQYSVGDRGSSLSGGQKQRVAIARAFYFNRPIVAFDEATSALDAETEGVIFETLNSIKGKKTIIVISHNIRSLKLCDCIYFISNNKILASGKYEDLIENCGEFSKLVSSKV